MPDRASDCWVRLATYPSPPATSTQEICFSPRCWATRRSKLDMVCTPPNKLLNIRRSLSEPATSAGVPASLSSSSSTTTRFMLLDPRQFFFQQLLVIKVGVVAVARKQFLMRAQFHHAPIMQHGNAVSIAHG